MILTSNFKYDWMRTKLFNSAWLNLNNTWINLYVIFIQMSDVRHRLLMTFKSPHTNDYPFKTSQIRKEGKEAKCWILETQNFVLEMRSRTRVRKVLKVLISRRIKLLCLLLAHNLETFWSNSVFDETGQLGSESLSSRIPSLFRN